MLSFRKKNRLPGVRGCTPANRHAARLVFAIRRRQQQAARLLTARFNRLPLWSQKACLVSFCLVMACLNGRFLVLAVWPEAPTAKQLLPAPAQVIRTDPPGSRGPALQHRQQVDSLRHGPIPINSENQRNEP